MANPVEVMKLSGVFGGPQAQEFRQTISELVQGGTQALLLDCGDVSFIDSSGLGALVVALKTIRAGGGQLYLCHIPKQMMMLFELTSMDKVFQILKDEQEFFSLTLPLQKASD
ncbi:STAS domain-containing protein [Thermosynechococcus sp.]|uniref:STAS domain-containing protein n=1 Tax=Thermosynechococcus sp. TaxID=2814275 RepID=UPI00391A1E32